MSIWYCGSTKWTAVTIWAATTAYSVGDLRRQTAGLGTLTAGNERVFRCTTAGTSGGSEPAWTLTKGGTTNDGSVVWTEVTGNSTYNAPNNFAAPHARMRNALSWMAAGDTCYFSNNHAPTEAATITLTSPGTAASRCLLLCIDDTQATATLATGATETTTGNSSINQNGFAYTYGISFNIGSGANSPSFQIGFGGSSGEWVIEQGTIAIVATGSSGLIVQNSSYLSVWRWINVILSFANAGQGIEQRAGTFEWLGGSLAGTAPTVLFMRGNSRPDTRIVGVDLSSMGSGKTLVTLTGDFGRFWEARRCKLGSSVALSTGTLTGLSSFVRLVDSDSSDPTTAGHYYQSKETQGDVLNETTIVRTGGATDGTVPFSRKLTSSTAAALTAPLYGPWFYFWNDSLGSPVTVAIEVVTDNVTLTDAEAWVEAEALTTSGFPLAGFASDRVANVLTTPANQSTSSETWTTTGLATPVKQVLSTSITPQESGWIRARVCLAKASTTLYACPKVG